MADSDGANEGQQDLGRALLRQGSFKEAAAQFQRALQHEPSSARLHRDLADALHAGGQRAEAVIAYQQAVTLDPMDVEAWWGMGCAQMTLERCVDAAASLTRVVELAPSAGEAHHNLGKMLFELGQLDPALDAFEKALALLGRSEMVLGAIATIIPGSPRAGNQAIFEARRAWAAVAVTDLNKSHAPVSPAQPPLRARDRDRPLRLGYVSSFFQDRNWMKPVWGLINQHDRERFKIHLFSDAPRSSIRHGYAADQRDRFHDVSGLANADAAQMIAAQDLDVLIDLNGYSALSRLPLFGYRPAPVIIAWFGMFATTGLSAVDYLIVDEHVILPDEERFFTERIVRAPGCYLTFEVTYPVPDVTPPPCRERGMLTFGCLAPQYKITTQVVEAWASILHGSPRGRLVLKNRSLGAPAIRKFVQDLFARFGIPPERLDLDGPDEHFTFLARYATIDIALDTFPYNGGTTTMEALWQGVPVLTFYGDRWAERISASLMRNAGLPEFVASDRERFIAQAIELANAPDTPVRLEALRLSMRDRLRASPACDVRGFARTMERIYTDLSQRV